MANYGKIIKGGLKAAQEAMSPAQKEANRAKFLEPSAVKERLYHGTNQEFESFLPWSHFGTPSAANERVALRQTGNKQVLPVHVQIKNPLRVSDQDAAEESSMMLAIKRGKYPQLDPQIAAKEGPAAAIKAAGYDGLVYSNRMEDIGKDSYVALDPGQVKSAIGNKGTYNPADPDITKAGGGPVKMGAGGLTKVLRILTAAEKEANKAKFLEPSKTQMRLYHGTTATEGGKGQEAIRRIKPSKEGSLGSGVYLTPSTAHSSTYSGSPNEEAIQMLLADKHSADIGRQFLQNQQAGNVLPGQIGGNMLPVYAQVKNPLVIEGTHADPMIEALVKLGMDEDKAARMVERAYENKGYIGKEVENRARAAGYDGLMQYRNGDLSEVVVYNPNAVKSAIGNQGTYDITKPGLSEAKGGIVHMGVGGALKTLKALAKGETKAAKAEGKIGDILSSQTAPMTTPSGTGLPLLPRSAGMYPPNVPQVDLPRMAGVDKARAAGKAPKYTERMQDLLDSPTARKKVNELIGKGEELGMREWYGIEPLRQAALDMGVSEEKFREFMAQMASASQRNPVDKQNQMGSYLWHLSQTGQLPEDAFLLTKAMKAGKKPTPEGTPIEFPEGYGSLAQSAILERGRQIAHEGAEAALPPNAKLGTFYRNLLGNLQPVTVDVNAVRGPVIARGDPRWLASKLVEKDEEGNIINTFKPRQMLESGEMSLKEAKARPGFWEAAPSGSEYAGFEDLWQRAAKRHGIAPAEAQALGWYGSADITALKTKPELYVENLERLIKRTAETTGKSQTEVLNDMMTGKGFLKKDGGAVDATDNYGFSLLNDRQGPGGGLSAMTPQPNEISYLGGSATFDESNPFAKRDGSDQNQISYMGGSPTFNEANPFAPQGGLTPMPRGGSTGFREGEVVGDMPKLPTMPNPYANLTPEQYDAMKRELMSTAAPTTTSSGPEVMGTIKPLDMTTSPTFDPYASAGGSPYGWEWGNPNQNQQPGGLIPMPKGGTDLEPAPVGLDYFDQYGKQPGMATPPGGSVGAPLMPAPQPKPLTSPISRAPRLTAPAVGMQQTKPYQYPVPTGMNMRQMTRNVNPLTTGISQFKPFSLFRQPPSLARNVVRPTRRVMRRAEGGEVGSFSERLKAGLEQHLANGGEVTNTSDTRPDVTDSGNMISAPFFADGGGLDFNRLRNMKKGGSVKNFDDGGYAYQEPLGAPEAPIEQSTRQAIKNVAGKTKEELEREFRMLKDPKARADILKRMGLQTAGGAQDLLNMLAGGVDVIQEQIPALRKPASVLDPSGKTLGYQPKVRLASDEPTLGSENLIRKAREAGLLGENEAPFLELAGGIAGGIGAAKAPKIARSIESNVLNKAVPNLRRDFTPATLTVEATAPDLGQGTSYGYRQGLNDRLLGDMPTIGGRRGNPTREGVGTYVNTAGELEINPMLAVDVPFAGNIGKAEGKGPMPNQTLRQAIAQAGVDLNQEAMAAHRFIPLTTNNIKDASAMLIKTKEGLTNDQVRELAKRLGDNMVVAHNPRLGGVVVYPFGAVEKGKIPTEFLDAQSAANSVLGKSGKIQYGIADINKDRLFMMKPDYAQEGAAPMSSEQARVRRALQGQQKFMFPESTSGIPGEVKASPIGGLQPWSRGKQYPTHVIGVGDDWQPVNFLTEQRGKRHSTFRAADEERERMLNEWHRTLPSRVR